MNLSIWATTSKLLQNSESGASPELLSYGISITPDLRQNYSAQRAIHLVTLLLAVVFDRHNVNEVKSTASLDLRGGLINESDSPANQQVVYMTAKTIESEYLKLKWSLEDMVHFNLRVRRWLSERESETVDGIGKTLYALLKDLDTRIKTAI
ncbi:hypothetical protein MUB04_15075 [Acinetobacter indicus]|uniref:hypothetical protein n=1 Tax=Acinetobacter TaxID=469 RepID=UPI0015D102A8|nr:MULTISPECIES: hypothetical protein [Acinetobacter]MCP0917857.1 hypothetical protein [Acinetobacter indicus]